MSRSPSPSSHSPTPVATLSTRYSVVPPLPCPECRFRSSGIGSCTLWDSSSDETATPDSTPSNASSFVPGCSTDVTSPFLAPCTSDGPLRTAWLSCRHLHHHRHSFGLRFGGKSLNRSDTKTNLLVMNRPHDPNNLPNRNFKISRRSITARNCTTEPRTEGDEVAIRESEMNTRPQRTTSNSDV